MESSGRSSDERRAAAEARARARSGEPPVTGDEELIGSTGPRGAEGDMSRHYGGPDLYMRRRLIAGAAVIVVIILLFLLVGGCQRCIPCSASSAINLARARDEVAAGDGAFRTCRARSVRWTTKSSTSLPSLSRAWARIPDGPGRTSPTPRSGTKRCRSETNARLLEA